MPFSERQNSLIDDLALIEDSHERMSAIIDRARLRPPLPDDLRTDLTQVRGCQSQVWIIAKRSAGHMVFSGDSDSPLVRGLVILACDFYSQETATHVLACEGDQQPLSLLKLDQSLSPTRLRGLAAVQKRIFQLAREASIDGE